MQRDLGEGVGEQQHQGNHQTVDGQSFHERQGEQQGAADLAFSFGLTGDTFHSLTSGLTLTDTRANGSQTDSQSSSDDGSGSGERIHVSLPR